MDKEECINIRYEADTPEELAENMQKAMADYNRLVAEGYPCVRVVLSNHWASEGIWVEAGSQFGSLSGQDFVHQSNQK